MEFFVNKLNVANVPYVAYVAPKNIDYLVINISQANNIYFISHDFVRD